MDPYRHRDMGYGYPSSSRSPPRYQTREVSPGPRYECDSSRRPSYRSVSPMGTSRFEREYTPPSMTPSRVAERNAPIGLSSFYSRDPYSSRGERSRPDTSRHGGERHTSSSRRPSTGSGYGGIDLSSLGGGFDGSTYGGMYGGSRRQSHSRRPSYGAREMPDFSRGPTGMYGRPSSPGTAADILGGPFGSSGMSSSARSTRYDGGYERSSHSRHASPSRAYSPSRYDDLDSAAPRQNHRSGHASSQSRRYHQSN